MRSEQGFIEIVHKYHILNEILILRWIKMGPGSLQPQLIQTNPWKMAQIAVFSVTTLLILSERKIKNKIQTYRVVKE